MRSGYQLFIIFAEFTLYEHIKVCAHRLAYISTDCGQLLNTAFWCPSTASFLSTFDGEQYINGRSPNILKLSCLLRMFLITPYNADRLEAGRCLQQPSQRRRACRLYLLPSRHLVLLVPLCARGSDGHVASHRTVPFPLPLLTHTQEKGSHFPHRSLAGTQT